MQTSYGLNQVKGAPGMLYDIGPKNSVSRLAESAVEVGKFACRASSDRTVRPLNTSGDVSPGLLGVVLRSMTQENKNLSFPNYPARPAKASVDLLKQGRVWMIVEEDVVQGDDVFVRYAGKKQVQTMTWNGVFVTGNSVTGKVNGTSVTQAFTTDHATTIAALAAKIALIAGVNGAVAGGNVITVTSNQDMSVVLSDFVTTGGAGQNVVTIAQTVPAVYSTQTGGVRKSADTSTAASLAGAKFETSALAGQLVVVELNLP